VVGRSLAVNAPFLHVEEEGRLVGDLTAGDLRDDRRTARPATDPSGDAVHGDAAAGTSG
jgi:CBS domain-containing protein